MQSQPTHGPAAGASGELVWLLLLEREEIRVALDADRDACERAREALRTAFDEGGYRLLSPYPLYVQSTMWRESPARLEALEHHQERCALCGSDSGVDVHHRSYSMLGCESVAELVVLCGKCHRRFHGADASEA